jgi:hypothetical protein
MKRVAFVFLLSFAFVGCRAPMPSANLLAPYGSKCVTPPPTGSINASGNYYTPATTPSSTVPFGTGFRQTPNNRWSNLDEPNATRVASTNSPAAQRDASTSKVIGAEDLDVALTSHQTPATVVPATTIIERTGPIRIVQSDSRSVAAVPRLRGMTVTDATQSREPRQFNPTGRVVAISELPDAPATTRTTSVQPASHTSQGTALSGGWQSR